MVYKLFFFLLRVKTAILRRWWKLSGRLLFKANGIVADVMPTLYGLPIISVKPNSKISIGKGVVLCSDPRFTDLGVTHPVIIRTLRPNAKISIGAGSGISGAVICAAVAVEIGSECLLGADVQIFDTDFHPVAAENRRFNKSSDNVKCAPVVIEDNVFLGAGSKIMKGVRIGRNSVIGAGAVVAKDIPSNSIAVGNPARVIGQVPT
ncbi:acyltransferase [Methylomonas sp. MO1]|jgi:acetyltransferase-like isoleucine patch superfamily enzyme|uniref:acyltransferase n=1 Tax=unclassified Methylomonas TaxID=2608980 RepID=UPI000479A97A|nr:MULTISPECIES: acyltransferase [unclassified Methylomonas]MDT4289248.1 acyltransferase [Methylomonas sp. MO1]